MAGAKRTVWDLALEITGQDKGAKAALASIKANIKDVQDAGKNLSKDFQAFAGNATKLALGAVAGIAGATAGVLTMANSFAEAGDKVAKTSAAIGIGIEAYQELQYAMGQSGVSAEEFDGALEKFNLTVKQGAAGNEAAAKQLEEVGLSAKKLAGLKPEQAMERLSDYMKSLPSDAERTRVAVTLFGKSAGPKMMAAMKQGSSGLRELAKEAHTLGIVMSEEQAHQSEAYGDAMSRLKQSVTGMKNQFIGGAIGPLTEAFDHLKGAIVDQMPAIQELGAKFGQWLGEMVARLPEIIARIKEVATNVWDNVTKVKDFVGGWKNLAVIIGVLISLKTALSGIKVIISAVTYAQTAYNAVVNITKSAMVAYKAAQAAAAAAGQGMTVVQWALNAAMAANPIGLIIAGIVALIAIIIVLVKNWDKVKEAAKKVWDAVVGFVKAAWEGIKKIASAIGDFFSGIWDGVKNVAGNAWDGIKNVAGKAWDGIKSGASKAGGFLKDNWKSIALGMVNPMAGGLKALYDHNEKFRNFVDNSWGKIKDFASNAWEGIKGAANNAWSGIKNVAGNAWEKMKGGASKAGEFLKGNWKTIAVGMVNPWAGGLKAMYDHNEKFRSLVDTSFNKIKDFATSVWNKMPDGVKDVFIKIKDNISGVIDGIKEFFTGLWTAIKEGPRATIEFLKNAFFGLFDAIKQKVESFVNFFKEKIEGVKNFFGGIGDKVGGFVGGAVDKFKSFLPGHAEGGIFTHRHIAEIAESGAEAVVPLNNSPQGFDIWKEAGLIGGYLNKAVAQTTTGTSGTNNQSTPPVMAAAVGKMSGSENVYTFEINLSNNFNGGTPDSNVVDQIAVATQKAADDLRSKIKEAMEEIARNQRRVSYA